MREFAEIRKLYSPIQPTVKQSAKHVNYVEFLPDLRLQNYIYCYWQLQTSQTLDEPFHYRVVADGCIDMFFELTDPADSYVMGFCKKYTEFPLENTFNYIGVRFLPTMFPQMFRVNAAEFSNRYETLESVIPATAKFIATHFDNGLSATAVKSLFDRYFIDFLADVEFDNDHRLYGALSLILKNYGAVQVETDLDTGISPRQLRRLFAYYIGDSVKTFSKVVRFQNILRAKPSQQSLRENKLFFDGYYDQAHFIKEFKNLYGVTPGRAFGR
ncbi:helix-turn-helix domain-containing protein [Dyadobacter sp. LJ53]|uniref:AraC family transcriptional regulator n=1 Tax=Dyadobacter chenwenxiniae TaxID=2906456 RepID=UPI001F223133|nr:helix-turn-helix domain-containing protein [Dyadobacter chenwenxiniae]MCF0048932.1 helix-turn-helix domain-containing protein [Dyadobacter chenwenxiniae]